MTTGGGLAPTPPQGPGVHPPFPAPPIEGKGRRIGLGLGIGGGVLLLVCGGGLAAVIGLGVVGQRAIDERLAVAVDGYFGALERQNYEDAYEQLCPEAKVRQTAAEFRSGFETPLRSHEIGDRDQTRLEMVVPVTVTYTDASSDTLEVELEQNTRTAEFEVCRVGE